MTHLALNLLMFALPLTGAIAWFGHGEIAAYLRACLVPADRADPPACAGGAGGAFCVLSEHAAADASHERQSTTQSGVAPKETLTRNAFFPRYGAIKRSCKLADACGQYWTEALGEPPSGTAVATRRLERSTNQKVNSRPIRAETAAQSNSHRWPNTAPLSLSWVGWNRLPRWWPITATMRVMSPCKSGLPSSVAAILVSGPKARIVSGPASSAVRNAMTPGGRVVPGSGGSAWPRKTEVAGLLCICDLVHAS